MNEPPQYEDTQDMMLRLANDAQHDVRPAKTASGASEREGGLRGLDSRPKTSEKEGGRKEQST